MTARRAGAARVGRGVAQAAWRTSSAWPTLAAAWAERMRVTGAERAGGSARCGCTMRCATRTRRHSPGGRRTRPARARCGTGRFLWARVLPWSVVFGVALWIAYKFVKGVIIGLGLGGTGLPTTIGVLATLALYTASVRLIERRSPDELGLAQLAPKLALGIAFGAVLFSVIMAALLAIGAYAMTGPTAAAPWLPLGKLSRRNRGGTDFSRCNLPAALEYLRNMVGARPLVRVIWSVAPG